MQWEKLLHRFYASFKTVGRVKYRRQVFGSFLGLSSLWLLNEQMKYYCYPGAQPKIPFFIDHSTRQKAAEKQIILVMDLDQTMVYTRRDQQPPHPNYQTLEFNDDDMYVQFRPYLKQYLQAVSQIFTVYVYTAGSKRYADLVLNLVDKERVISKRFYRDSCRVYRGAYIKDLKKIQQSKKQQQAKMILVDDNPDSILFNAPNSIKIKPFTGDQSDEQLIEVQKTLKCQVFNTLLSFYS